MYEQVELLYENQLTKRQDVQHFVLEGEGAVTFPMKRMRLESTRDPSEGQKANLVYWCPEVFPDYISISWDFWPIRQPGLCILFFSATGRQGENVLDPSLATRCGIYDQYHHGDLNAYHLSYFRKSYESERKFQTCNLRKSFGFHLVAHGADPIPGILDVLPPYHMKIIKAGADILFYIDELLVFQYIDDDKTYGSILGAGQIGFRQMAPLIAEYANFKVHRIRKNQIDEL